MSSPAPAKVDELISRLIAAAEGIPNVELAEAIGVSNSYIGRWKKGYRPRSLDGAIRRRMLDVLDGLERSLARTPGIPIAPMETVQSAESAHAAGYALAIFESIRADARHIIEKADEATRRLRSAPSVSTVGPAIPPEFQREVLSAMEQRDRAVKKPSKGKTA